MNKWDIIQLQMIFTTLELERAYSDISRNTNRKEDGFSLPSGDYRIVDGKLRKIEHWKKND